MGLFKNTQVLLILIILVAALLRLPFLDVWPSGITVDEAGQAYSAYSILKTGKDEWGDFLPLNPRGFGDYKPPLFMYLLVPSVAIFGLTELAVRLPSAIAGILTVLIAFFLVRDLFKSRQLGLLASCFMAIAPWHVYYSRLGWESNVGLMFFTLGIWLFIKGIEKGQFLALSALSFGLAGLSYHSFKLLVPLMVLSLTVIFWKQLKHAGKKSILAFVAVALVFVLVLGYGFVFSGASRRAEDQSIFKEENFQALRKSQVDDGLPQPLNRIVYNKYQFIISKAIDNYLGYYSLSFLFGPHRSEDSILNFPSMGLLYIWQLPLTLLGTWYLLKNRSKGSTILLAWVFLAPIPAAITQDYMHAGRAQALFPALTTISAVGLSAFFEVLKKIKDKPFFLAKIKYANFFKAMVVAVIAASLLWRVDNYLFHTFNKPLGGLKQGYDKVLNYTEIQKKNYNSIVFTNFHSEPHAFLGFYLKLDPKIMQNASVNWKKFESEGAKFLDMTEYELGQYKFRGIDVSRDRHEKNSLIIASPKEVSPLDPVKAQFKDLTGETVFVVIDTNEIPD